MQALNRVLIYLAKLALQKHRPIVIGVAGSSWQELSTSAIYQVLRSRFSVRSNILNKPSIRNICLTILNQDCRNKSWFGWVKVIIQSLWLIGAEQNYAQILVLNIGSISHLDFINWRVVVVSDLQSKQDKNQAIRILSSLSKASVAVLNFDYKQTAQLKTPGEKVFFGCKSKAPIKPFNEIENYINPIKQSCLIAQAIGLIFDLKQDDIKQQLIEFDPPAGVLKTLSGIKNITIIDHTFNAVPSEVLQILDYLNSFESQRKIAVIGDLIDLGQETEEKHQQIGKKAGQIADVVWTVGTRANCFVSQAAKKSGADIVREFDKTSKLGLELQKFLKSDDIVLVCGCAQMNMGKIVEEIRKEPR